MTSHKHYILASVHVRDEAICVIVNLIYEELSLEGYEFVAPASYTVLPSSSKEEVTMRKN